MKVKSKVGKGVIVGGVLLCIFVSILVSYKVYRYANPIVVRSKIDCIDYESLEDIEENTDLVVKISSLDCHKQYVTEAPTRRYTLTDAQIECIKIRVH